MLVVPLYGSITERREYNNGICKQTGKPWEHFSTNSQGNRGYVSKDGYDYYYTWVSYPGIDGK